MNPVVENGIKEVGNVMEDTMGVKLYKNILNRVARSFLEECHFSLTG